MPTPITLQQHNPDWVRQFEQEANKITGAYGPEVIIVHHIGSTAIPDIVARPIIDILVEVRQIEKIDALNELIEKLGYQAVGEHGIPGRRFFIRNTDSVRTHNVYIFPTGHPEIQRCLDFRDYLITHPQQALFYSLLKRELARRYPEDLLAYMRGKEDFIQEVLRRAETWRSETAQVQEEASSPEETPGEETPTAEGQPGARRKKGPRYFPRRKRAARE